MVSIYSCNLIGCIFQYIDCIKSFYNILRRHLHASKDIIRYFSIMLIMEIIDLMLKRRSTRKFTDEPVTKAELDKILQAALLAPTSMNRKPCSFMVVERKETLMELSKSKDHGAGLIKGADRAIVVVADEMVSDTWIEDSSIALTYMHLMATELGLGSCWVQIHLRSLNGRNSEEIVREILKIDDHYRIVGIMAFGHSEDIPEPHCLDEIDKGRIHFLV